MAIIELEKRHRVAVVSMNQGENRHNPAFLAAFNQVLDEIEADHDYRALVLASSDDKNWSLGLDTDWLFNACQAQQDDDIRQLLNGLIQLFKRLLSFPVPVIAALNGHTYGNGAVLACACDFRFMRADRGFFCFPEVNVGVPFFPSMFELIERVMPSRLFNRMLHTGERQDATTLLQAGVIEQAIEGADETLEQALAFAQTFDKPRWVFAENKRRRYRPVFDVMEKNDPQATEYLIFALAQQYRN
jgi:enoyl-CoA hydratase/carnithine racemase